MAEKTRLEKASSIGQLEMKTTIIHPIYGRIEYDSGKDRVSVQRGDLAERIKWMLRPENERLLGHGIRRDQFIEACAVLGVLFGAVHPDAL
jgi:hypothetical protein